MAKKNAFTLIELLVVIAIIAILAAVVLVSLGGARQRAKDARVTSDLNQYRTRAVLVYDKNTSYADMNCNDDGVVPCTCTDGETKELCDDINNQNEANSFITHVDTVAGAGDAYCAYSYLVGLGKYWCVDSDLHSKQYDAAPARCIAGCLNQGTATECRCE